MSNPIGLRTDIRLKYDLSRHSSGTNKALSLRGTDKVNYRLFHIINGAWNNPAVNSWERFEKWLRAGGVEPEYKYRRGTSVKEGISFVYRGKKFSGSEIDRKFSFASLDRHFMELQKSSVKASSPARQSTVQQPAVTVSVPKIDSSPVEEQGWSCGGDNETWPEFRAKHPELSAKEGLRRFHAKKRGGKTNGGFHI